METTTQSEREMEIMQKPLKRFAENLTLPITGLKPGANEMEDFAFRLLGTFQHLARVINRLPAHRNSYVSPRKAS